MPADFEVQEVDDLATLESGLDALETTGVQEKRFMPKRVALKVAPVIFAIAVVLGIWQLLFALKIKPDYVIPSPQMVWNSFTAQWKLGMVWPAVQNSITRGFIGFAISVAIATPLGILISQVKFARLTLRPVLSGLQQLPSVAWVPAAIIWFGLSPSTIYCVVILGATPSIANGLAAGIDQIPPLYLRAAKVLGISGFSAVRQVVLPAAFPGYLNGLDHPYYRYLCRATFLCSSSATSVTGPLSSR